MVVKKEKYELGKSKLDYVEQTGVNFESSC